MGGTSSYSGSEAGSVYQTAREAQKIFCEGRMSGSLSSVPAISVDGRATTHVTFDPGVMVGGLVGDERLCFTSFAQSTSQVDVALHGYLAAQP